ncbi:flagellar export chaperone FliS [Alienimonas sp. DA493]|uniref:flagellar export chaperone FliS n=1 Tax=Alienimonas sp. DA493 TaxID=3373605 RepID=UPI0037541B27
MTDAAPYAPARNDYLRTAVTTASPAALHGMLADAAVRFSARAAELLAEGPDRDEAAGYAALDRATALVAELLSGVKPDAAAADGEAARTVAEGVQARFAFCLGRLAEAGRTNAAAPIRDAVRVLTVHADTWRELLGSAEGPGGTALEAASPEPLPFVPAPAPEAAASAAPRSWAA